MQITVEIPDDIDRHPNPGREALEALVIAGYSSGAFSAYQGRMLLGMGSRFEFDGFLKEHAVEAGSYGIQEFEEDLRTLKRLDEAQREKRSA